MEPNNQTPTQPIASQTSQVTQPVASPELVKAPQQQGSSNKKKYLLYAVLVVLALVILVVIAGYFISSQKSTSTTAVPTQSPVAQTNEEEVADITDESELDSLNDELATDDGTLTNELNALEGDSNF